MVTRISGINSGLDIDSLVTQLMRAEKMPLDKLKQKKTTLSWTSTLYREINTKLATFKTTLDTMRLSGDWKKNSTTSSNSNAVSITADGNASAISHSINVSRLAQGANVSSKNAISTNSLMGTDLPPDSTTTPPVSTKITSGSNDQLLVTLGGMTKKITLAAGDYSQAKLAEQLQTQIDNAFGANKISVNLTGNALNLQSNGSSGSNPQVIVGAIANNEGLSALGFTDGQSNKINVTAQLGSIASKFATGLTFDADDKADFVINGQTITFSKTDSLASVMNQVNNSPAGVNMTYDDVTDKIVFTTKSTGTTAQIKLENGSKGNFVSVLNMLQPTGKAPDNTDYRTVSGGTVIDINGIDADVTIDGVQSYRSSNTFTSSGVTYTLKQTTTSPVTVGISQDIDSAVDKIKKFIASYNDTIELLNKRVKENKFRDYAPLTDDQRKGMEAEDIKSWEEKAKSGLLHNDNILTSAINGFRSLASTSVGSMSPSYNALYKIGISTKPYNLSAQQDSGKLDLDEDQLRKALSEDPAAVTALFSNQPDGIAQKMYDQATKSVNELIKKAGGIGSVEDIVTNDIGFKINDLNRKISDFNVKLTKKETYYYNMFTTMDNAIGKNNSTLTWLAQNMSR
ncbi:flagellar filament capping protein FliD [Cohnella sp. REN36]|uniref:flagellar filament capping protein FliD n=1 Tax=Cohnella sp. REN36 TaxID=2887347 RepID=UPI001D145AAB|nr:flagellar filament capping protein FliD [Cohnella sp. REN36]MCC3374072.1 flagellar filament capping protein FliD [Cohnella sp. REN36]